MVMTQSVAPANNPARKAVDSHLAFLREIGLLE